MRNRRWKRAAALALLAAMTVSNVASSAAESSAASVLNETGSSQTDMQETETDTEQETEEISSQEMSGTQESSAMAEHTEEENGSQETEETDSETIRGETAGGTDGADGTETNDAGQGFTVPNQVTDEADVSPLIVTEIVSAGPSNKKMTYTEVYNNSDAVINFGDYTFYYQYPSGGGQVWNTGDLYVEPGHTVVLWQSNNKGDTVEDFNAFYGVQLEEGKDIYQINYGGIHTTAERWFAFGRDEDSIIAFAKCNVGSADITDRDSKLAIQYEYAGHGSDSLKKEISQATPGTVEDWQVPDQLVHYESPAQISVSDVMGPEVSDSSSDSITVTATVTGNQGYAKAYLYYRQDETEEWSRQEMDWQEGTDTVTAQLSKAELWKDQVTWYVKATYGNGCEASSEEHTTQVEEAEVSQMGPFIVTEVVTPPENASGDYAGNTQFSYVELYNCTNVPVNYSYYNFYYEYTGTSTADKTWTVSDPAVMIQPGETLVLWLTSNGNTVDDFNAYYGTDLVEGEDIAIINYAGFHNTQWRTLKFGHTQDTIFASASFNEGNEATIDRTGNESIQYTYPRTEDGRSIMVSTDTPPSPGSVEDWQVPDQQYDFQGYDGYPEDDGTAPILKPHDGVPESVNEGDELSVIFDISDTMGLIGTKLHYRLDGGEWTTVTETSRIVPYFYVARISADAMFGHDTLEFYVEAFNNFRSVKTETYQLSINRINDVDGVRLNLADHEVINGTYTITANDGEENKDTKIYVDGEEVSAVPMLENGAYYAFLATDRNSYFKNVVTASYGDNDREIIQYIGKWQDLDAKAVHIDNKYFTYNAQEKRYEVTLTLWAGDSGTPFEDIYIPDENHEDYKVSQVRLLLANGREYLPVLIEPDNEKTDTNTSLDTVHTIGDSSGMSPWMSATFHIPEEEVTAVGYALDTTTLADGTHTVTATAGDVTKTVEIVVDNTVPEIELGVEDGEIVEGTLEINPQITDANAVSAVSVVLDGEEISVPYSQAVRNMEKGEHTLSVIAEDVAGNVAEKTVSFQITEVDPVIASAETEGITDTQASLSVKLEDVNTEGASVSFYEGRVLTVENGDITVQQGEGNAPLSVNTGSRTIQTVSPTGDLPYQMFTIETGEVNSDDSIYVNWEGYADYADSSHAIRMYVLNVTDGQWEVIATPDAEGSMEASFAAQNHVEDGKAVVLVQCRALESSPSVMSSGASVETASETAEWDGTDRPEDYDFAFAWITDTQYYAESWPEHFTNQNQWIVDHADDWKIRYVMHTGDIVDDYEMMGEWTVADEAMSIFDKAGMPYGVLAGNHDVAAGNLLYQTYWQYFGQDRFEDQPTYGGSYKNNAGHYDLLTENGQDFIMLYMSWDIYTEEIEWMNDVLAQYPDRKAIILLHRYTNVKESDGTYLDYAGKVLQENVVAKNPNVIAVLNGHYHGSSFETTAFDDNGDGIKERTVYQICTDYQSGFEGGSEYIKFLYFDLDKGKIYMNSYSPFMDDYNYYDTEKYDSYEAGQKGQDIDIFELNVAFDTTPKTLECSQFSAGVRTNQLVGMADVENLQASAVYTGLEPETEYIWYAQVTNEKGGLAVSDFVRFTTQEKQEPTDPTDPTEPTVPTDPTNPTEPTVPTDPTNPTVPTDPTDPTEPTVPTDPTNPTEPTDPTQPTDPTEPTVPAESQDGNDPSGGADTGDQAPVGIWMIFLILAVGGCSWIFITAGKKKSNNESR